MPRIHAETNATCERARSVATLPQARLHLRDNPIISSDLLTVFQDVLAIMLSFLSCSRRWPRVGLSHHDRFHYRNRRAILFASSFGTSGACQTVRGQLCILHAPCGYFLTWICNLWLICRYLLSQALRCFDIIIDTAVLPITHATFCIHTYIHREMAVLANSEDDESSATPPLYFLFSCSFWAPFRPPTY